MHGTIAQILQLKTIMHRVVITGFGIVSCLGNDEQSVKHSLYNGISGICHTPIYAQKGLKAQCAGLIDHNTLDNKRIERKLARFLSDASLYAYLSALDARQMANLDYADGAPYVGVIAGSGGASTRDIVNAIDAMHDKGVRGVGACYVPKTMASGVSAALATGLKVGGVSYSIASACATSTHCIGQAFDLIRLGRQSVVFAGGGEGCDWTQSCLFDGMGAMSSRYNDTPTQASRPYDKDRDGFVIAGGGGMVILESLEFAKARGATILAEVVGFGATSDGADMVAPSGEGASRCMQMALADANLPTVDYINTHGTSTPAGDITELQAIASAFSDNLPMISSTKSMSGHSLGAAGVHELIYSLIMLKHNFVAPSINIANLDPKADGFDIIQSVRDIQLNTILSNSFGFGGTNASIIIKRFDD